MSNKNEKIAVPDISSLLGTITKKREELPKTEIQEVRPVESDKTRKQENNKTQNHLITKTQKQKIAEPRGAGGRPSIKRKEVAYVRIGPNIPKALKQQAEIALVEERFQDDEGRPIVTLDEIVTLALTRLLKNK